MGDAGRRGAEKRLIAALGAGRGTIALGAGGALKPNSPWRARPSGGGHRTVTGGGGGCDGAGHAARKPAALATCVS